MRRFLRRPSAPMVVACGALFLASTGTGLADIAQLGRNTVGTPQLRNNAVTTPKVRNGAVTTPKIRNRAVTLVKLAPNARIPGPRGPAGPQGPQGPPGPAGPPVNLADGSVTSAKLATGAVTASKLSTMFESTSVQVPTGQSAIVLRSCGANRKLLAGGASWSGNMTHAQAQGTHLIHSGPTNSISWLARGYNGSGSTRTLTVSVICASAG